ncbi:MAG: MATE family efflux transporter [Myxococcota bacterium]
MTKPDKSKLLGTQSIPKLLFRLSTPAAVGMISIALYNLVDTIFVGRGVSVAAIGAISIVFPVHMIIMGISQLFGIGGASLISRCLGAKEKDKAEKTLGNVISLVFIFSNLMILASYIWMEEILVLFGATPELLPLSMEYLRIVLVGFMFFTYTVSLNNIARAEGAAKIAMTSMLIGAAGNLILDPIFIFMFKLGVSGAALATTISQIFSFVFLLGYFLGGKSVLSLHWKNLKISFELAKEIVSIGISVFVRQTISSLVVIIFFHSLGHYGSDFYISIYGIIHKITMFLFMPLFGLVQGLQPIVGYNYGAKNYKRVVQAIKTTLLVSFIISITFTLIIYIFPHFFFSLFNKSQRLQQEGARIIRIMIVVLPLVGVQIVGSATFLALGKAVPAFILSISRQVLFLIPLLLLLPLFMGLDGVWYSLPLSDICAFILSSTMLYHALKKLSNLPPVADSGNEQIPLLEQNQETGENLF